MESLLEYSVQMSFGLAFMISILLNVICIRKIRQQPSTRSTISGSIRPNSRPPTDPQRTSSTVQCSPMEIDEVSLTRLVRVYNIIEDEIEFFMNRNQEIHPLREIQNRLNRTLDEHGVEQFSPSIGESYRTAYGVTDHPDIISTLDSKKDWTIARVIRPGFRAPSLRQLCLSQAMVSVYRFEEER